MIRDRRLSVRGKDGRVTVIGIQEGSIRPVDEDSPLMAVMEGMSMAEHSADFEDVEIARKDLPDVRFRGKLLAEADSKDETRQDRRNKDRWTRLAVWELESGDWVAASIGCSDKPGEIDIGEITVIKRGDPDLLEADYDGSEQLTNLRRAAKDQGDMQREAMEFWGWTWLAKSLAQNEAWDVHLTIK